MSENRTPHARARVGVEAAPPARRHAREWARRAPDTRCQRDARLVAPATPAVILFDGDCGVCNAWVQFVLDRDPIGRFRFASLRSPVGTALLTRFGRNAAVLDSMVLVEGDVLYDRSTAVLLVVSALGLPWALGAVLLRVPAPLRDSAYDQFARHRYWWSRKLAQCRLTSPDTRGRFL